MVMMRGVVEMSTDLDVSDRLVIDDEQSGGREEGELAEDEDDEQRLAATSRSLNGESNESSMNELKLIINKDKSASPTPPTLDMEETVNEDRLINQESIIVIPPTPDEPVIDMLSDGHNATEPMLNRERRGSTSTRQKKRRKKTEGGEEEEMSTKRKNRRDMSTWVQTSCVATNTETEMLGPCEPGTPVALEGIVWNETNGALVVNVTWRGKSFMGTLLDCSGNDWSITRLGNCDSPLLDLERTPSKIRGNGKRANRSASVAPLVNALNVPGGVTNGPERPMRKKPSLALGKASASTSDLQASSSGSNDIVDDEVSQQGLNGVLSSFPSGAITDTIVLQRPLSPVLQKCPCKNCGHRYADTTALKYHQNAAHRPPSPPPEPTNRLMQNNSITRPDVQKPQGPVTLVVDESAGSSAFGPYGGGNKNRIVRLVDCATSPIQEQLLVHKPRTIVLEHEDPEKNINRLIQSAVVKAESAEGKFGLGLDGVTVAMMPTTSGSAMSMPVHQDNMSSPKTTSNFSPISDDDDNRNKQFSPHNLSMSSSSAILPTATSSVTTTTSTIKNTSATVEKQRPGQRRDSKEMPPISAPLPSNVLSNGTIDSKKPPGGGGGGGGFSVPVLPTAPGAELAFAAQTGFLRHPMPLPGSSPHGMFMPQIYPPYAGVPVVSPSVHGMVSPQTSSASGGGVTSKHKIHELKSHSNEAHSPHLMRSSPSMASPAHSSNSTGHGAFTASTSGEGRSASARPASSQLPSPMAHQQQQQQQQQQQAGQMMPSHHFAMAAQIAAAQQMQRFGIHPQHMEYMAALAAATGNHPFAYLPPNGMFPPPK